ncbi:DedA family protein [Proteobacteria bacterium 005FR1]|nr:DedA family protein [Proteobacteria bacterium 005FR1]
MNDWIIDLIRSMGAPGVGLLMFAENLFPPLPSEFIMPLAGYLSTQGAMSLWLIIVTGSIGSLAGALFWYLVGKKAGSRRVREWIDRQGAWLGLCSKDLDESNAFFRKHGNPAVFFGRLVPVVRTLISVPAGMSSMSVWLFLFYSSLGTILWTALLAWGGYLLGQQFEQIGSWLGPVSWVIIGAALAAYFVRVYRIKHGLA